MFTIDVIHTSQRSPSGSPPCLRVGDEVAHIGDDEMNDDIPNLAFDAGSADSELATAPVNKITWTLGRPSDRSGPIHV